MIRLNTIVIVFVFLFSLSHHLSYGNPIVYTKYGAVEGTTILIHTGHLIDSFLSIPFAKPPVDDLRFSPPEEPEPWNETFSATYIRSACMQGLFTTVQISHFGWTDFDEDCLHLNVYTPQRNETNLLPVFVFIHGGGFMGGANFLYPGYFMAAKEVVVVNINYRLGIFGYSTTEDDVIPGNMGMLDQVLALQFIQENIETFGGDPNRVTICGESAGGASVGLHLMSSLSTGLFHNAILHSGNELSPWVLTVPDENPRNYLEQVAEQFDCPTDPSGEMVDCLRNVPALALSNAEFNCTDGYDCGGSFGPVIDGIFLTDFPSVLRDRGEYNKVPEIIGINDDESSIWVVWDYPYVKNGLNRSDFDNILSEYVEASVPKWPDGSRSEDVLQALRFQYTDWPYFDDPEANREMLIKLETDYAFGYTSDAQAKSHSENSPVFYYVYDYMIDDSIFPEFMGTFHGVELVLLFGWPFLWMEENEAAFNHSQANTLNAGYSDDDKLVSDTLATMWTNFAKYSKPTTPDSNIELAWPEFSNDNLSYAYLVRNPEIRIDYRQEYYAFWMYYLNYIIYGEEFFLDQGDVLMTDTIKMVWNALRENYQHFEESLLEIYF